MNRNIRTFLVGDSAYPIFPWSFLMTGSIPAQQKKTFNYRISRVE